MIGFKVSTNKVWHAPEMDRTERELYVYAAASTYCDGVKLGFGDAFSVTLTPHQAVELGQRLASIGAYKIIFKASFGLDERDAKILIEERNK